MSVPDAPAEATVETTAESTVEPTAEQHVGTDFSATYAQHLPAVSRYLARRVETRFVEDLAADVFAVAWQKRESVVAGEELPWLYRIAANLVGNHRRKQAKASTIFTLLSEPDTSPSAEDIVIADQQLAAAWKKLKPRDREVLALALLEDLPVTAIAQVLGASANAVSIRLHRAKKTLGDLLRDATPEAPVQ
jgi:RNA polymerase sigma-70 factor (ECF subfamily)